MNSEFKLNTSEAPFDFISFDFDLDFLDGVEELQKQNFDTESAELTDFNQHDGKFWLFLRLCSREALEKVLSNLK